jgi:hypothetical protein
MPPGASRSAAGPTLGVSATAEPSSPKPIAPRARCRASEAPAGALWAGALRSVTRAGSHDDGAATDDDRGGDEIDDDHEHSPSGRYGSRRI